MNKDLEILLDVRDMFGNGMVEKINKGLCTFISYQFLKCKSLRRCTYFLYFHNIKITHWLYCKAFLVLIFNCGVLSVVYQFT